MGSEKYAYFSVESEEIESQELDELARDAGLEEVPGGGDQVVARLDAASEAERDSEIELWVDATKLHLFDQDSGREPHPALSPTAQVFGQPVAHQVRERVVVAARGARASSSRSRSSTSSSQSWVRSSR